MRPTALLSLLACPLILAATAHAQDAVPSAAEPVPWARADVLAAAEKAADYQIDQLAHGVKPSATMKTMPAADGWEQGAFFVGLATLADHSSKPELAETLQARGTANGYAFGARPYDADDQTIGAAYFWDYRHGAGDRAITPMRARMDAILAHPPTNDLTFEGDGHTCRDRWCWADALFMGPQVWLEMSRVTGDAKYAAYAKREFFATVKELYDPQAHLFYRDSRFFERRDINGAKLFWSRGDGWVFAGIARMLDLIPADDPDRPRIVAIYREMAVKLKAIQRPDGFWSPSLLGDPQTALPEESGTAFYTYGMAWGVKNGILDRADYEPVVRKGWAALTRCLHPDGRVGYVQPVSDRPDAVDYDNTQFYGIGGFLMAASAVADLDLAPIAPVRTLAVDNPSAYDQAAAPLRLPAAGLDADNARAAGGWSVVMDGHVYAAQYNKDGSLGFVLPLKAHAQTTIELVPQAAPLPLRVQAILNVQDGGTLDATDHTVKGGVFHLHHDYQVPAGHATGDHLIAFDGIGWESDKTTYRLTLDGKNAVGALGKAQPDNVLQDLGQGTDPAPFTAGVRMGESRDGVFTTIDPAAIDATILADGPVSAEGGVTETGVDRATGRLTLHYTINMGSPLTWVDATAGDTMAPMAVSFPHAALSATHGAWGYAATYEDGAGVVIFFRTAEGALFEPAGEVTFKNPEHARYAFAAISAGDGSGVGNLQDFKAWIATTVDGLDHPATVRVAGVEAAKKHRTR